MSERLLPPESGPWSKAAAYTFDTNRRISYATGTIKLIGITVFPEDWLPWLVYEYGLEEVADYVSTLKQALVEGRIWLRRRGTPDGIRIGLEWVGTDGVIDAPDGRHKWWEFQIGFQDPPTDIESLKRIDGIVRLSKAAEDDFFRMFMPDFDFRPVRMDDQRFDDGWMDDYSGSPRWEDGPYVSFGLVSIAYSERDRAAFSDFEIETSSYADRKDDIRYDVDRFDDSRPQPLAYFSEEREGFVLTVNRPDVWLPSWTAEPWSAPPLRMGFVYEGARLEAFAYGTHNDDTWRPRWTNEPWSNNTGRSGVATPLERT